MKHLIHKAICWYLARCGGAFHCGEYGPNGKYVEMTSDERYGELHRSARYRQTLHVLIAHGTNGDGDNLDKAVRRMILDVLPEPEQLRTRYQ